MAAGSVVKWVDTAPSERVRRVAQRSLPVGHTIRKVVFQEGDTWVALTTDVLSPGAIHDWAVRQDCGAIALFSGTVRDHADHRTGVSELEYEAYVEEVEPRLLRIAEAARNNWPDLGRIALLHRIGVLGLGDVSVVVAVSSPHRPEAFEAARFGIDTLKATIPIWKRETWEGGEDWGLASQDIIDVPQPRLEA